MVLDESAIIQIDATVIAGLLILLTITPITHGNLHDGNYDPLDALGGISVAANIVILPFALSAIFAAISKLYQEALDHANKVKPLFRTKISLLNEKIESEKDPKTKKNLEKQREKHEKKLRRIEKKDPKFDDLRQETDRWNGRILSLITMVIGFFYLLFIMIVIAQSASTHT